MLQIRLTSLTLRLTLRILRLVLRILRTALGMDIERTFQFWFNKSLFSRNIRNQILIRIENEKNLGAGNHARLAMVACVIFVVAISSLIATAIVRVRYDD